MKNVTYRQTLRLSIKKNLLHTPWNPNAPHFGVILTEQILGSMETTNTLFSKNLSTGSIWGSEVKQICLWQKHTWDIFYQKFRKKKSKHF